MPFLCERDDDPLYLEHLVMHLAMLCDGLGTMPCWVARNIAAVAELYARLARLGDVGRRLAALVAPLGYDATTRVARLAENIEHRDSFACGDALVSIVEVGGTKLLAIDTKEAAAVYTILDEKSVAKTLEEMCTPCRKAPEKCERLAEEMET